MTVIREKGSLIIASTFLQAGRETTGPNLSLPLRALSVFRWFYHSIQFLGLNRARTMMLNRYDYRAQTWHEPERRHHFDRTQDYILSSGTPSYTSCSLRCEQTLARHPCHPCLSRPVMP